MPTCTDQSTVVEIPTTPRSKLRHGALVLVDGHFQICSLDVISDPEFFCQQIYDVTLFDTSPWELVGLIRNTITPDEWDDTNGDGTMMVLQTNGFRLLVVSQHYDTQLKIRNLLRTLDGLVLPGGELQSNPIRRSNSFGGIVDGNGRRFASESTPIPRTNRKVTRRVLQSGTGHSNERSSGGVF